MKKKAKARKKVAKKASGISRKGASKRAPAKGTSRRKPEKSSESSTRRAWVNENMYTVLADTIGDLDETEELAESTKICSIEDREHLSFVMLAIPGLREEVFSVVSFADPANPEPALLQAGRV